MRLVHDPCRQWAVFRMLNRQTVKPYAQISVLQKPGEARLYACESVRTRDSAGNRHVICAGIDLAPALDSLGVDAEMIIGAIGEACRSGGGSADISGTERKHILSVARILNIGWIESGLESPASIICPRSASCPRPKACAERPAERRRPWLDEVRDDILQECADTMPV